MADKRIQDLTAATSVQSNDLFVLEQSGAAKKLTGAILMNDLATALDGHGGISDITYTAPVSPSLDGTLTITLADNTSYTVTVSNGKGISSVSSSKSGLTTTVTIAFNDGTSSSFAVDDGNGIASIGVKYGISNSGSDPVYVSSWESDPVAPTDQYPYGWTKISITDSLGNTTDAYSVTVKADDPSITVGTVTATSGSPAGATITNSGTVHDPVLDFSFTLPKGDTGDTGDYIEPVVSYGTSTAAATEPSTWYNDPTSISYAAGNFIWKKTDYTLHDAQTVQDTVKEIIGYIGQNGAGSGTVTQITFNSTVFPDDGTGNVDMTVDAEDVGAIADPSTKSNGQVLTYDSSADEWVAANPTTGNVNTVNSKGVDAGTTNITLYGTDIKMSSSDNTTVQAAIPAPATATPASLGTPAAGSSADFSRADHVHAMPSNSDVGVDFQIFDSVADIGLQSGTTISAIWDAMPENSMLYTTAGQLATGQKPNNYGMLEIVKRLGNTTPRGKIEFHGTSLDNGKWEMFFNSSNKPDGTWLPERANNITGVTQNLLTNNDSSNPYIAPTDGYAVCFCTSGSIGNVLVCGAGQSSAYVQIGNEVGRYSVFVRAGMKLWYSGSPNTARFAGLS